MVAPVKKKNEDNPVLKNAHLFYQRINEMTKKHSQPKEDFFGAAPNLFVGKYGYPNINVGILSNEHVDKTYDDPKTWFEKKFDIPKIVSMRSFLINSNFRSNIKSFNDKLFEITKEVAMAKNPVDVEVNLEKKPTYKLEVGSDITPYGPTVKMKKAEITENPHIPTKVEKVYDQDDLKASDAMNYLSKHEIDEHYLTKLLSAGTMGLKTGRKLVPTRWSITAVDDTLGKNNLKKIKDYESRTDYLVYTGDYMGNFYVIMFFPEVWSYELFETYMPNDSLKLKELQTFTDYEGFGGRKEYAYNTVGGYYAARLPVTEMLINKKRQGSALLLRFVTDDYWVPLGVWVVRQTVRTTLNNKPLEFGSKELMLKYVRAFIQKKFGYDCQNILDNSKLLNNMKSQMKLGNFF
jgi:DNA repair protein NreA